jgi:hypothetical protein
MFLFGLGRRHFLGFSLESLHGRAMIALRTYGGRSMRRRDRVPGCIFINNGHYWWRIRLPGEATKRARPLIHAGGRFATDDPGVAEEIARDMYARAVFEHGQADARPNPRREKRPKVLTVAALVREYLAHARRYYVNPDGVPSGEAGRIEIALRPLIEHWLAMPVEHFGPLALKEYRERAIEADFCRSYVNKRVGMIRRMSWWAVEEQLVPPSPRPLACRRRRGPLRKSPGPS